MHGFYKIRGPTEQRRKKNWSLWTVVKKQKFPVTLLDPEFQFPRNKHRNKALGSAWDLSAIYAQIRGCSTSWTNSGPLRMKPNILHYPLWCVWNSEKLRWITLKWSARQLNCSLTSASYCFSIEEVWGKNNLLLTCMNNSALKLVREELVNGHVFEQSLSGVRVLNTNKPWYVSFHEQNWHCHICVVVTVWCSWCTQTALTIWVQAQKMGWTRIRIEPWTRLSQSVDSQISSGSLRFEWIHTANV